MAMVLLTISCSGQDDHAKKLVNRKPAVSGKFYPSDSVELGKMISGFYKNAQSKNSNNVLAIISPHAGYVFSGQVAASAFNQVDENKKYENIFIIGSSHTTTFSGASVYNMGNWDTPLGTVPVNMGLGEKLTKECSLIHAYSDVHRFEHSLEVQLPFLQMKLKHDFKIIPIVLGTQSNDDCMKLAEALRPYFNSENLFVISTDMSHYPSYDDALTVDKLTSDAIISGLPQQLADVLYKYSKDKIKNLATSLCGWTSVLTLLYMTYGETELKYNKIQYMNSGDIPGYGDRLRVVGYGAFTVSSVNPSFSPSPEIKEESFSISEEDKKNLLDVARKTLDTFIRTGKEPVIDTKGFSSNISLPCGAFVTLHKNGKLRGCIGKFVPKDPLWKVVQLMTVSSSSQDMRFSKVTKAELTEIDIEISVLTPLKKIKSIDEFELGKHGIYMIKENHTGTFLPQVAKETNWSREEFLGHCARDKAGIGWDGWKDADLFTYEAIVFGEKGLK